MISISRRLLGALVAISSVFLVGLAAFGGGHSYSVKLASGTPGYTLLGAHSMPAAGKDNLEGVGEPLGERMVYGGGPVQTSPKVYLVFWHWTSDPDQVQPYLTSFFQGVGGSDWIQSQDQYCQQVPTTAITCANASAAQHINTSGPQLAGTWDDNVNPIPNTGGVISEPSTGAAPDLAAEAVRAVQHFGYDPSAQYVIATPTGISTQGFAAHSGGAYCAWHGAISLGAGQIVSFTNLPYMPDAGLSCGQNLLGNPLDGVSIVAGHEYAESMTDPDILSRSLQGGNYSGWGDSALGETGDKCAWQGTQTLGTTIGPSLPGYAADIMLNGRPYAVQSLWANDANNNLGGCEVHYTPPAVTAPATPTLTMPGTPPLQPAPAHPCYGAQMTDNTGDAPDPFADVNVVGTDEPSLDIQHVTFNVTGSNLEITTNVNDLAAFPQGDVAAGGWSVYWNYNGTSYVATVTSDPSGLVYADGVHGTTNTGTPVDGIFVQDTYNNVNDSGRFDTANGNVVIDVPLANVGSPPSGAQLTQPFATTWGIIGTPNAFNAAEPVLPVAGGNGQGEYFTSDEAPDGNPTSGDTSTGLDYTVGSLTSCDAPTATTLSASATRTVYGQAVTFTAHVAGTVAGVGTPTGNVSFRDGQTVLGSAPLSAGAATLSTQLLGGGQHSISAAYQGSAGNFAPSTSGAVTVNVARASTPTALTASTAGQQVTLTATLKGVSGAAAPTGTVTFYDGTTQIGTAALSGGVARLSVTLALGKHTLTAVYGGDANYLSSTSKPLNLTVR